MNTYKAVYKEHSDAVITLQELGGDPEAICKMVDEAYSDGENWLAEMAGMTNEDMANNEAYGLIQRDILHRWFAKIPRPVMLTLGNALLELPCGKLEYIPGETLTARDAMDEWNKAHPDEEPLRIIGEGAWSC